MFGHNKGARHAAKAMRRGARMMAKGLGRGPFGRRGRFADAVDGEEHGHHHGRGGHGRGGMGRGRRMFGQGELRLLLLGLIGEAPRHGYDLIRAIEGLTGGAYAPSPGVVYPTLALLVDEGLIAEEPGEGSRRAFAATAAGQAEIAKEAATIEAIMARLRSQGEASEREASPSIMRAMANLKLALRSRVFAAVFNEQVAHQIADILDEAARQIERV